MNCPLPKKTQHATFLSKTPKHTTSGHPCASGNINTTPLRASTLGRLCFVGRHQLGTVFGLSALCGLGVTVYTCPCQGGGTGETSQTRADKTRQTRQVGQRQQRKQGRLQRKQGRTQGAKGRTRRERRRTLRTQGRKQKHHEIKQRRQKTKNGRKDTKNTRDTQDITPWQRHR